MENFPYINNVRDQKLKKIRNKHRVNAFLYAFYAVAHLIIIATTLSILGWHGVDQFIQDLKQIYASIAPIGILALVNIAMAILCWKFVTHSKCIKILTLVIAGTLVALPAFVLIFSLTQGGTAYSQIISFGFVVIYSIPAFSIAKEIISNESINRTENTSVLN